MLLSLNFRPLGGGSLVVFGYFFFLPMLRLETWMVSGLKNKDIFGAIEQKTQVPISSYTLTSILKFQGFMEKMFQSLPCHETSWTALMEAACNVLSIAYGLQIANAAVLMTNMFGV